MNNPIKKDEGSQLNNPSGFDSPLFPDNGSAGLVLGVHPAPSTCVFMHTIFFQDRVGYTLLSCGTKLNGGIQND